ncbi:MAG: class I SAM-dependent methyltransferase [Candidatus Dormibacteraeota bacterium]|nr:class I SAM-dependent methyltransferase [Candidatus Dormibacteraeota bacterium]
MRASTETRVDPAPVGADPAHERLFTSGEYVGQFQPDIAANPFAATYAAKRDAILDLVPGEGLRVVDVGGGPGRMSRPLARRHDVTLCDLSRDMLELARGASAGDLRKFVVADARALPLAAASFDVAICIDVVPHLADPGPALRELHRVLAPGGTLIVDSTNSIPAWTLAYPRYIGRRPGRWWATWRAGGVLPEWRNRVWHRRRAAFLAHVAAAGFTLRASYDFGPRLCPKWHLAVVAR